MARSIIDRFVRPAMAFLFSLCLIAALGCGDDDGDDPGGNGPGTDPTATELTDQGWDKFEDSELDSAEAYFVDALDTDSTYGEAWTGRGWVDLLRDSLSNAISDFDKALALDTGQEDAQAGKAALLPEIEPPDFQGAVDAAESVLSGAGRYIFDHDTDFDWMDLRLIMAQSFFALTFYDSANVQVDSLGGTPADSADEWYVDSLAVRIQRLGETID